jgi:periplasmic copper chaperone A
MSARRLLFATVLPAALLAGPVAGSAFADTPTPVAPTSGGPGTVTFAAAAGQTPIKTIEVDLPIGTPLRDVSVPATPGWTSSTTKAALPSCGDETVSSVTWTATGGGIAAQHTGSFAIQVGSFPKTDQMEFDGVVTYADGKVANWTQQEGVGAPGSALAKLATGGAASAVTVKAETAAPQPIASVAPQPVAPATNGNLITTWTNTFVKMVMSVW